MRSESYIPGKRTIFVKPELVGNTLTTTVRVSRDLRSFFRREDFYIRYEQDIDADESVLSIPGVALLLPLAWLTGSNIHVRRLDRTFAEAAEAVQSAFRAVYPRIPFGTQVVVEELADAPPNPEGSAMLFSGGLDATYTFYAKRHLNPRLIQVFGTEFPIANTKFLDLVKKESLAFADRHGVDLSFLYTNFFYLTDHRALFHAFATVRERVNGDIWKGMGYVLGFLAMTAPLSAGRFNHLLIAAWADKERADRMRENPDSSSPKIDQKIAWSNLRVEHHGCMHRNQKVREMKDWLPGNNLRVCWMYDKAMEIGKAMNCSRCEKCARSIVALALGGVDPEQCGFIVYDGTIKYIQGLLAGRIYRSSHMAMWWGPLQLEIPEQIEGDMFGLRGFMEWFRAFDLGDGLDPQPSRFALKPLYRRLPWSIALAIRYFVFGIRGEPYWVNRPEEEQRKA